MSSPLRVLILEDSAVDAELLVSELERAGFAPDVQTAQTKHEFLAQLDPALDLILADYRLPQFNALEALCLLQERRLEVPLIVVTGSLGDERAAECIKRGAADYLLKDRLARLGGAVQHALEWKRAQEANRESDRLLRDSEERFYQLANNISQLAWMARPDGQIFWYNQRWYDYTGTTLADMEGGGWRHTHHPDHVDRVAEHLAHCFATGEPWEDTFPLRGKNGSYCWFLSRARPICNGQGQIVRWFGTHTDITAQREAEHRLRRNNEDLRRFAWAASHDLAEPLRMVTIYTQVLERHLAERLDEKGHQFMTYIRTGSARMNRLIAGLRQYWEGSEPGGQPLEPVDTDLMLTEVLAGLPPALAETGLEVTRGSMPVVQASPPQVRRVFDNLIRNAVQFHPPGVRPQVQVSAVRTGTEWVFTVRDSGKGIAPRHHEFIFGLFKQLDREDAGRVGMGLTLAAQAIEQLGGRIWVESNLGEGAAFHFTVPAPE